MALQVWLPLNGSIENQGLLGSELITNGPEINYDDGKLGKALHRGGLYMTAEQTAKVLNNQEITICFWVYVNADTGSDNRNMLFGNGVMYENANRKFSLFQFPTCNDLHYSFMNDAANVVFAAKVLSGVLPSYKWTHVAMVYKNPTIKIFINGELRYTETDKVSSSSTFAYTTQVIYDSLYHKFNDYRLYDNALSDREIHEIAKGLVVHYPLSDVYCTGSSNLYSGEYAEGKCSHGGFSPTKLSGERGYNYKLNYTGNGGNNYHSFGFPTIPFTVGKTYDYSCKIRCRTNNCSLYMRASRCCNDWTTNMKYIDPNGVWTEYHIRQTMTGETFLRSGTTDTPKTAPELEFYTGSMSTNGTVYAFDLDIKDVQICEANTSVEFADGSFNTNTVYDVSGFGNHGRVSSEKPSYSTDSPRYDGCTVFNGSNTFIIAPKSAKVVDEITVSIWGYCESWSNANSRLFSCTENGGWNIENIGNAINFPLYVGGSYHNLTSAKIWSSLSSGWHHFAVTYNGLKSCLYIDGKLDTTSTWFTSKTPITYNVNNTIFLGAEAGSNVTTPAGKYFNGKLSDFRLYATALSDKDIAELYNTPMCITNNGALMTQGEFKEV